jgi:hypothetical protein
MKPHFVGIMLVLAVVRTQAADRAAPGDEQLLAQHSIAPTAEGIAAFFKSLRPDPGDRKRVAALIAQLSDASFEVREAATNALVELPVAPSVELEAAAKSDNLEAAARAKLILQHPSTRTKLDAARRRRTMIAPALRTMCERQIRGLAPPLLEIAPQFDGELSMLAGDAMAATARSADESLLRKSLGAASAATRAVAIRGLASAAGDAAKPLLVDHSRDPHALVALAAAHAMAERRDRTSLALLVKLAGSDDPIVRVRAVQVLRAATAKSFGENPYRTPAEQKTELAKWTAWLTTKDGAAPLRSPLVLAPLAENLDAGLVLHYTFDEVSGRRLTDGSGHARHGTTNNMVEYIARGRGKALKIVGANHHGDAGGHAIIPFVDFASLKQFTLSIWVLENRMTHEEGEAYVTFGVDRGTNVQDALGIAHLNANVLFRVGDGQVSVSFAPTDAGRWVHYAMTFVDGRLAAYKDGKQLAATTARVSVPDRRYAALGRHWWSAGDGTSARFVGALDDLRIYNRALTREQIQLLFESTK